MHAIHVDSERTHFRVFEKEEKIERRAQSTLTQHKATQGTVSQFGVNFSFNIKTDHPYSTVHTPHHSLSIESHFPIIFQILE